MLEANTRAHMLLGLPLPEGLRFSVQIAENWTFITKLSPGDVEAYKLQQQWQELVV